MPTSRGTGLGEYYARVPRSVGGCCGIEEIGVVQEVEVLGTKLQGALFAEPELLEEREVQIGQAGTRDNVAAGVSVLLHRRIGKSGWIEPLIDALLKSRGKRIADHLGPKTAGRAAAIRAGRGVHREREPTLQRQNPIHLPSPQNSIFGAIPLAAD